MHGPDLTRISYREYIELQLSTMVPRPGYKYLHVMVTFVPLRGLNP